MAEEEKVIDSLEELTDEESEGVAGGFPGSDKYTKAEYSQAGVTWSHYTFYKDTYYIRGVKITQSMAEKVVENYRRVGRPLTDHELRLIGVPI